MFAKKTTLPGAVIEAAQDEHSTSAPAYTFKPVRSVINGSLVESRGVAALLQALSEAKTEDYRDLKRSYMLGKFVAHMNPTAKAPTQDMLDAAAIILDRKGYQDGANDTRRTAGEEQVYGAARVSWKRAADKLGIKALDARGAGSKGRKPRPAAGALGEQIEVDKASGASVSPSEPAQELTTVSSSVTELEFALRLVSAANRYIAMRGKQFQGEYADIIRHFVEDIATLKAKETATKAA